MRVVAVSTLGMPVMSIALIAEDWLDVTGASRHADLGGAAIGMALNTEVCIVQLRKQHDIIHAANSRVKGVMTVSTVSF
jgi:hypothetical protein